MRILITLLFLTAVSTYGQDRSPIKSGLGIVAIKDTYDVSKIVGVYRDKDFKVKIEDFRLYGELKRVWPYYFKPDYGLCSFVCLEKTKSYFKVLINDKEEGFLKNDTGKYFQTWESLLKNASVERLAVKSNPLKEKPGDDQKALNLKFEIKPDIFEVIDVVEIKGQHWIKVRFSKSGNIPCDEAKSDCGTGWIKWKSDGKLLVHILLLC